MINYSLYPHKGDWKRQTLRYELNNAAMLFGISEEAARGSGRSFAR